MEYAVVSIVEIKKGVPTKIKVFDRIYDLAKENEKAKSYEEYHKYHTERWCFNVSEV